MPKMQNQIIKQYKMLLNIISQFYRKYDKLSLFDNIQCTTKLTSHVPQNQIDKWGITKAGNLYIMKFDFIYIGND